MSKPLKLLLILLFAAAFVLRIWGGADLFFWNIDEDRFALMAKRILVDLRPVLIGYSLPGGEIYLGPIFPYILALWYLIVKMNPFGLPILSAFFGAITTLLVYKVGSIIFDSKRTGLFASIVYAFSFLANVYARVLTELTIVPILSLLVYLILYQNIKLKKPTWLIWLGAVLLVASQNEGSSFSLIILAAICFFIFKLRLPLKKFLAVFYLFVAFHVPVAIFELRHNFFISKAFVKFFFSNSSSSGLTLSTNSLQQTLLIFPKTLSRFLLPGGTENISGQILPCSDLIKIRESAISNYMLIASGAVLIFFLYLAKKGTANIGGKIIALHFLIIAGGIFLYSFFKPGWFYEWLLVIFFPAFALIVGFLLARISGLGRLGKIAALTFLSIFTFYNLRFLFLVREDYGLNARANAVKFAVAQIGNKPFFLDSIGSCYAQGYNFLFWHYGNFPKTSYSDDSLTPTFYERSTAPKPGLGVVMVSPSEVETSEFYIKYNEYKQKTVTSKQIGEIEVLIVEDR